MRTDTLPAWSMSYQIKELLLDDGDSPFVEWFGLL
jgi:hypothetical protein